jgi:hypothetical protein
MSSDADSENIIMSFLPSSGYHNFKLFKAEKINNLNR